MTGTIALAARTGSDVLRGAAGVLFVLLAAAWLVVAARTLYESARAGCSGRRFPLSERSSARPRRARCFRW